MPYLPTDTLDRGLFFFFTPVKQSLEMQLPLWEVIINSKRKKKKKLIMKSADFKDYIFT